MVGYVYRITNIQTNQAYIGITENFNSRKQRHLRDLKNGCHHSPKLQEAWNYWGEDNFEFTCRSTIVDKYDDLYDLEIAEIKKYDSYNNGYNCNEGGKISDWKQKVRNEDIVKFLCVQWRYGDGYGKTAEKVFGWSKGTASSAKRKLRFMDANIEFEKMSPQERQEVAEKTFKDLNFKQVALERQLTQGGCLKAYQLTSEDFYFAFAAQQMGYSYSSVAEHFGIKSTTVKDWFNGRSRKREKEQFNKLSEDEKSLLFGRVKTAGLSGKPKSVSSN